MTQYANTNIWTPPKTWSFEELVGQTALNQQIRDNMLFGPGLTRLVIDNTEVGNVGTGEDELLSYSLPAGILSQDGMALLILAAGNTANNANAKRVDMYFGSSNITALNPLDTSSSSSWNACVLVMRTGGSTQLANRLFGFHGTTVFGPGGFTTPNENLSSAVTIKCTAQATNDDDVVQKLLLVVLLR